MTGGTSTMIWLLCNDGLTLPYVSEKVWHSYIRAKSPLLCQFIGFLVLAVLDVHSRQSLGLYLMNVLFGVFPLIRAQWV